MANKKLFIAGVVLAMFVLISLPAKAEEPLPEETGAEPQWIIYPGQAAANAPAVIDTVTKPNEPRSYVVIDGDVKIYDNNNRGNELTHLSLNSVTKISDVIKSIDGNSYIIVTNNQGIISKYNATRNVFDATVYTNRDVCPGDKVSAPINAQTWEQSNQAFKDYFEKKGKKYSDIVYVITHDYCSDHSRNRVIAYYLSDFTKAWTFNLTAAYNMDYSLGGCALDLKKNVLYCATNKENNKSQNTLWAINSLSGALIWAADAGPISVKPILFDDNLYVATAEGKIKKYNLAKGKQIWEMEVFKGGGITKTPWVGTAGEEKTITILAANNNGELRKITDKGASGELVKPWLIKGVTTDPLAAPKLGKVFVGNNKGEVLQVNIKTGSVSRAAQVADGAVQSIALGKEGGVADANRLIVTAANKVSYYTTPWRAEDNKEQPPEENEAPPDVGIEGQINIAPTEDWLKTAVNYAIKNFGKKKVTVEVAAVAKLLNGKSIRVTGDNLEVGPGETASVAALVAKSPYNDLNSVIVYADQFNKLKDSNRKNNSRVIKLPKPAKIFISKPAATLDSNNNLNISLTLANKGGRTTAVYWNAKLIGLNGKTLAGITDEVINREIPAGKTVTVSTVLTSDGPPVSVDEVGSVQFVVAPKGGKRINSEVIKIEREEEPPEEEQNNLDDSVEELPPDMDISN